jgi:hypothetical protein
MCCAHTNVFFIIDALVYFSFFTEYESISVRNVLSMYNMCGYKKSELMMTSRGCQLQ